MRKVFLILLALVLALSVGLVACGGEQEEEEEEEEVPVLDHFICYTTDRTAMGEVEVVQLKDQFTTINATVKSAKWFCNAVNKTYEGVLTGISHPDHHLTFYQIEYEKGAVMYHVQVKNQFQEEELQSLTVSGPVMLAVPTHKVEPGDHKPPVHLDHFLVYKVEKAIPTGVFKHVNLKDQWRPESGVEVRGVAYFAKPVQKTHDGGVTEIENRREHLVFYTIKDTAFPGEVNVFNQFGNQTLKVLRSTLLGVPSANITETKLRGLKTLKTGGGSVTTPGEGTFTYDEGTAVNLVATPDAGYRFVNWTGDVDTVADVNAASTTITMNGDYSITANFEGGYVVTFANPNLEAAVREAIGIPEGLIYPWDLEDLTILDASEAGIADLTGLEYCTGLTELYLGYNQIEDISPLANLTGLSVLSLSSNQVTDISALADLTNLTELSLCCGNQIIDISPLAGLTNLTELNLCCGNQITDVSPLANLTSLTWLGLCCGNQITDVSPLVQNEGLGTGDYIGLGENPLSPDSISIYIPELEARGVTVDY